MRHLRLALRGGDLLANAARDRCNYTLTLRLFSYCCFVNVYPLSTTQLSSAEPVGSDQRYGMRGSAAGSRAPNGLADESDALPGLLDSL